MTLAGNVKDGDWVALRQLVARLGSLEFGPNSTPEFNSVKLTGLTASRLVNTDSAKTLESVADLTSWIAGTANEISVTDDSDGTITIGIVDPLIVGKGGTGAATLTDHGILLGSGTDAVTALGAATNGQIPIGSTGFAPVLGTITGTAKRVSVTNGAGTITLSGPQDLDTVDSPVFAGATIGSIAIPGVYNATAEPTGVVDRVAVLSWVDATRTLTITGDHDIYIYGVKTTKNTSSIQIADTTGLHWIYYNAAGVLTESLTRPAFALPWMASVYWNTTVGFDKGLAGEERHSISMDADTHDYLHSTVGSRYESGLAGTFDAASLTIATGKWHDEDIEHNPAEQTTCNVLYKNGAVDWEWDTGASIYYKLNGANLRYNNDNALADAGANQYVASWIFATNDISTPIVAIIGQRVDTTIASARENNTYASLSLGDLPFEEMKLLYRVILRNTGSPPTYVETQDLRNILNVPSSTYLATLHSALTGLSLDDHTQYALLAGRTGGQALYGSDTTAEDLTLGDNSVDGNTITVTEMIAAYTHSGLVVGNPHSVTPTELGLVIGTNVQAYDAGLLSLAGLTYASASFIKVTAEDTYAIRTIAETKTDLSLDAVENTALSTWVGSANVTTLGTIATGIWNGTDIAIADGGTGQGTAQAAIDALTAVTGATNEHVLTKDTVTGNAIWKAASGGSDAFTVKIDAAAAADYIGAASNDGVLRTSTGLSYTDGGDFITIANTGMLGDGSSGRTLRQSRLLLTDGTNASTIKATLTDVWNGDTIAVTDNISKGATTGNYYLTASGKGLRILATGLSGNPLMAFPNTSYNTTGTQVMVSAVIEAEPSLEVSLRDTAGIQLDITVLVNTPSINIELLYITDA